MGKGTSCKKYQRNHQNIRVLFVVCYSVVLCIVLIMHLNRNCLNGHHDGVVLGIKDSLSVKYE